jgi:hypothetical protein
VRRRGAVPDREAVLRALMAEHHSHVTVRAAKQGVKDQHAVPAPVTEEQALSLEYDDPQGTPQPKRKIVRPREARDVFRQLGKATTEAGHAMQDALEVERMSAADRDKMAGSVRHPIGILQGLADVLDSIGKDLFGAGLAAAFA